MQVTEFSTHAYRKKVIAAVVRERMLGQLVSLRRYSVGKQLKALSA